MRGRLTTTLDEVREVEVLGEEVRACPSLRPLMARIARRPGRWQRRMAPRHLRVADLVEGPMPEAA